MPINFYAYKLTEAENGYYMYLVSQVENPELFMEQVEHWVGNSDINDPIIKFLDSCDWDGIKIEKTNVNPNDIINKSLPNDNKCLNTNTSNDFLNCLPPQPPPKAPKVKKEPKPKAEKPKAKKSTVAGGKVIISNDKADTFLNTN